MKQGSLIEDNPDVLRFTDPERYYDLYVAPVEPIKAKCLACGYNKMYHDTESNVVYCGRCGGAW